MKRAYLASVVLAFAGSVSAKEATICETAPGTASPVVANDTKFFCPGSKEAVTIPDLYKAGWRVVASGGNLRGQPASPQMTFYILIEKD